MSRVNPVGFVMGIAIELAAILTVVALVPRMDLRSKPAQEASSLDERSFTHETSYYQRRQIEQQLDQAGTALVNGVSARVLDAAADVLTVAPTPQAIPQQAPVAPPQPDFSANAPQPWVRY